MTNKMYKMDKSKGEKEEEGHGSVLFSQSNKLAVGRSQMRAMRPLYSVPFTTDLSRLAKKEAVSSLSSRERTFPARVPK